jgi:hypothetical protein
VWKRQFSLWWHQENVIGFRKSIQNAAVVTPQFGSASSETFLAATLKGRHSSASR